MKTPPLLVLLSLSLLAPAWACVNGNNQPVTVNSSDDGSNGLDLSGDDGGDDGAIGTAWSLGLDASVSIAFDATVSPSPDGDPDSSNDWPVVPEAAAPKPDASCTLPLGPGVLAIDELLVESVAGTGDYGEWLEVVNTAGCAVDLRGLHGACAAGMKVHTFDVTDDVWIGPYGFFLVADSDDPDINHYLPGVVIPWAGQPGDVLRNEGATVTLTLADVLVDSLTYPSVKWTVGASIAFPATCPITDRSDWTEWQTSTASWFPGFFGTPSTPNVDIACL
jgi:hypothetical protein